MKWLYLQNQNPSAMIFGFRASRDRLVKVLDGAIGAIDDLGALNALWAENNRDDRPRADTIRSMSVGDVVILDGVRAYAIGKSGYKLIALPAFVEYPSMSAHTAALGALAIYEAHEMGADTDAGFDGGEFSGPEHDRQAEKEVEELILGSGARRKDVEDEIARLANQ